MMPFIEGAVLKSVLGAVSSGPAGWSVVSNVTHGTTVDASTQGVEVELDAQSLESDIKPREDKLVREIKALAPQGSFSALQAISARAEKADNQYADPFARQGLTNKVDAVMSRQPFSRRTRGDMRSVLSRQQESNKNPLLRRKERQLHEVRATGNRILKKKTVPFNAAMLPEPMQREMNEQILRVGGQVVKGPTSQGAAGKSPLLQAYGRWGFALQTGSYIGSPGLG
jgi:hypothetical protein